MAFETDLLEYGDLFDGSKEVDAKVEALKTEAREEMARIEEMGGAISAIESSYMKQKLVESNAKRLEGIEHGEQTLVGVNKFQQSEPSPLAAGEDSGILTVDPAVETEAVEKIKAWRAGRDANAVEAALADLRAAAEKGSNIMEPSIACAKVGVTTGEWGQVLRDVFGEYRAPTGVGKAALATNEELSSVRHAVDAVSDRLGRRLKILVGKPGLDGHSNGAEPDRGSGKGLWNGGGLSGHSIDPGTDCQHSSRRRGPCGWPVHSVWFSSGIGG